MHIFILIPTIICYAIGVTVLFIFMVCFVFCHLKKRQLLRSPAGGVCHESDNKSKADNKAASCKRIISNYLYGMTRFLSIAVGNIPSHRLRKLLLKHVFCVNCHPDAVVYGGFELRSPWNIKIGKSVIGVGALLDGRMGIEIEDDVCLAQSVYIFTLQHNVNDPNFSVAGKGGKVIIKNHAWVSSKTTILPGCVVEEGVVVASGATLTKSTEPYGIYGGVPAKRISERQSPMCYNLNVKDYWHFY